MLKTEIIAKLPGRAAEKYPRAGEAIRAFYRGEVTNVVDTATTAITLSTNEVLGDLRRRTALILGTRVARAWRATLYPPKPGKMAAGFIYTKAPRIIEAFDVSGPEFITPVRRRLLAIPTENAPKKGTDGRKITPANWPAARLGPLRLVAPPGRAAFLVADDMRQRTGKRGGFGRASKGAIAKGNTATVVMFRLYPIVKLRKELDVQKTAEPYAGKLAGSLAELLGRR